METVEVTRVTTYNDEHYDISYEAYAPALRSWTSGVPAIEVKPGTAIATKNIKSIVQVSLTGFDALRAMDNVPGYKLLTS